MQLTTLTEEINIMLAAEILKSIKSDKRNDIVAWCDETQWHVLNRCMLTTITIGGKKVEAVAFEEYGEGIEVKDVIPLLKKIDGEVRLFVGSIDGLYECTRVNHEINTLTLECKLIKKYE